MFPIKCWVKSGTFGLPTINRCICLLCEGPEKSAELKQMTHFLVTVTIWVALVRIGKNRFAWQLIEIIQQINWRFKKNMHENVGTVYLEFCLKGWVIMFSWVKRDSINMWVFVAFKLWNHHWNCPVLPAEAKVWTIFQWVLYKRSISDGFVVSTPRSMTFRAKSDIYALCLNFMKVVQLQKSVFTFNVNAKISHFITLLE